MQILVFDTEDQVDAYAAQRIIDVVNSKEQPVIGFATGSTPQGTYAVLIKACEEKKVSFAQTIAFNLDEYVGVDASHPCSFAHAMRTSLFDHIDIPKHQIYALHGDASDMEKECQAYEECIAKHPIDLQLLGIGMDGHIAYNEPGTPFTSRTHVVDLHPESIESSLDYGFTRIEDVPRRGVTQGIATILQADTLCMIAKGKKKAALVKRMLEGKISEDFPSSIIQQHDRVIVVLDKEAASLLQEGTYEKC